MLHVWLPNPETFPGSETSYSGLPDEARNNAVADQNDTDINTRTNVTSG